MHSSPFVLLALCGLVMSSTAVSQAAPVQETLEYVVALPFPIDWSNAAHEIEIGAALGTLRAELPQATMVFVPFDHQNSTRADWLAVLDACGAHGFRLITAFYDLSIGEGYRPTKSGGVWNLKAMGAFASDPEVVGHPQLYAVAVLDEPWNAAKTPSFYPTSLLRDLYQSIKAIAGSTPLRVMMNFSREIWKFGDRDDANDIYYYAPGICDVVQISNLEFQRDVYDVATLDSNNAESRRIIARETPDLPLFATVQVFGGKYGPYPTGATSGYWFPRESGGMHDLLKMLEDVTRPKYEFVKPLTGLAFQKWDSNAVAARDAAFTLGDAVFPNTPAVQALRAREALDAVRLWLTRADGDADGMIDYLELLHGLDPGNPADAARDSDGDGQSNADELCAGTDPNSPSSVFKVQNLVIAGTSLRLQFTAAAGKRYRLQSSVTLSADSWVDIATVPAVSVDQVLEVGMDLVPPGDRRFYRLMLTP